MNVTSGKYGLKNSNIFIKFSRLWVQTKKDWADYPVLQLNYVLEIRMGGHLSIRRVHMFPIHLRFFSWGKLIALGRLGFPELRVSPTFQRFYSGSHGLIGHDERCRVFWVEVHSMEETYTVEQEIVYQNHIVEGSITGSEFHFPRWQRNRCSNAGSTPFVLSA